MPLKLENDQTTPKILLKLPKYSLNLKKDEIYSKTTKNYQNTSET